VLANIVDLVMHLSSSKKMVIEAKFLVILTSMNDRGKRMESCSWGSFFGARSFISTAK